MYEAIYFSWISVYFFLKHNINSLCPKGEKCVNAGCPKGIVDDS